MTLLQDVADGWLERLTSELDVTPVREIPFTVQATGESGGVLRIFEGPARIVDARLTVSSPPIDSVMLMGYAPTRSPVPHLISDIVNMPDGLHFEVDLVPRVDLVTQHDYLDTVYPPLEAPAARAEAIEGATPLKAPRRLKALLSPWCAGVVTPMAGMAELDAVHRAFQDRWLELLAGASTGADDVDAEVLHARDVAQRVATYDVRTDPLWDILAGIIGREPVHEIMQALRETY